jgi:hypothetical protein
VKFLTALAFGLGSIAALAEEAPGAKSDITIVAESPSGTNAPIPDEGKSDDANPGALALCQHLSRMRAAMRRAVAAQATTTRCREHNFLIEKPLLA